MKDRMNDLFRERFQGHEAPVDPAMWQVIEARLLTSAPVADPVNEIFRERFTGHELNVPRGAWQSISAQLGHGAVAGFGGFGWIAAGLGGLVAVGGLLYVLNSGVPEGEVAEVKNPAVVNAQPIQEATIAAPAADTQSERSPETTAISPTTPTRLGSIRMEPSVEQAPSTPEQIGPVPHQDAVSTDGAALVDRIITQITDQVEDDVRAGVDTNGATIVPQQQPPAAESPAASDDLPPVPKPFMPNTFTPNNDGINDVYVVPMDGFTSMLLRVYSMKSNQLVFSTNSGEPWTGSNCEDGWYMVAVEAMTVDGRLVSEGKAVWLNRTGMN